MCRLSASVSSDLGCLIHSVSHTGVCGILRKALADDPLCGRFILSDDIAPPTPQLIPLMIGMGDRMLTDLAKRIRDPELPQLLHDEEYARHHQAANFDACLASLDAAPLDVDAPIASPYGNASTASPGWSQPPRHWRSSRSAPRFDRSTR